MLNLKTLTTQKQKTNMTPNKNSLLTDFKQLATIIAVIMVVGFLLTISEDKSNLKAIPTVNAQAQAETLTPEMEINKLKLELEIKQKQAELSKIDPKAPALK